ncbi:MAG: hypothetical protein ACR2PG_22310 [Hyphomicrobiaceae bacterium]
MKNIVARLFAFASLLLIASLPANAGSGTIKYKPGALQAALANGETILVHYKSTW